MPRHLFTAIALAGLLLPATAATAAGHRVLLQGGGQLAIVDEHGEIEWRMPWGGIHDIHLLDDGHILVQQGAAKIAEIDPETKSSGRSTNATCRASRWLG